MTPDRFVVASFVEAWIEIFPGNDTCKCVFVASFVEAWIEICFQRRINYRG